jgi:hypothetical protein
MVTQHSSNWVWLLVLLFGVPWIAASIVLWRNRLRDGYLTPSFAELSLRR